MLVSDFGIGSSAASQAKVKELQDENRSLKAQIAALTAEKGNAAKSQELAVAKKAMELQEAHYKAVEEAMKNGYQRAIDNLKELRGFAQGM